MKKNLAVVLALLCVASGAFPALAAPDATSGQEQLDNAKKGGQNVGWGWTEYMERTHQEAAKGKGAGEQVIGVVGGSAIGIRKGIHRIGAGAIDLLTFWIPKKRPLIDPEEPPVQ